MKQRCHTLKRTCIHTAIGMVIFILVFLIWGQPSFTTQQTFRRMEAYRALPHSQIVYTNRGIWDASAAEGLIDAMYYKNEDIYLGQYGDLYYFAAIAKAPVYLGNGESDDFAVFQPQEGAVLATTWNLEDTVPKRKKYASHANRYIAGVVTDPAAAKVEAEIWFDDSVCLWTSITEESLNNAYGSGPPWKKTVETTEFYHGMFLIYTGIELWQGSMDAIAAYGYTITVYDADGNILAQHDQPMDNTQSEHKISPASGILDRTICIDGSIAAVAIENTNDYDVELCADYALYYANNNNIPSQAHRLDTDEAWIVIPAEQTREFAFDYIENKPINLFSDEEYYNTITCVVRPVEAYHGGEYSIEVSKNT